MDILASKEIGAVLLVSWGVVISFFLFKLSEIFVRQSQRKRIASFMGRELSTIKKNAQDAIKSKVDLDEKMEKEIAKSGSDVLPFIWIDDADLPTLAFQSVSKDIVALEKSVSLSIQNAYHVVEYTHHWKKKIYEYNLELKSLIRMYAAEGPQPVVMDSLRVVKLQISQSAERYGRCLNDVVAACDTALGMLKWESYSSPPD